MIDRRTRVVAGFTLIGAGIVVAVLGYLGVSAETEVAFQLPYFASAGIGALLLLGIGATLLTNAQLESDTERLEQIEDAIRQLAAEVERLGDELVPRRRRSDALHVVPGAGRGTQKRRRTAG